MNFAGALVVAFGLAMDAFAVSIACGTVPGNGNRKTALKAGAFFGGFQAVMPVIGWFIGMALVSVIFTVSHWVASAILLFIGFRMVAESWKCHRDCRPKLGVPALFTLAIATSIDALAAGLSLSLIGSGVALLAAATGIITFLMSFFGIYCGKKLSRYLGRKMEAVGGIVLMLMGLATLAEQFL